VTTPVRVIMGSKDPDFKNPETEARWVAERLRGDYPMVQGAGHYPHAEMPEIAAPLVIDFLHSLKLPQATIPQRDPTYVT
jgi:pimeloyl-ACP methyl ester carboxylesterase